MASKKGSATAVPAAPRRKVRLERCFRVTNIRLLLGLHQPRSGCGLARLEWRAIDDTEHQIHEAIARGLGRLRDPASDGLFALIQLPSERISHQTRDRRDRKVLGM